MTYKILHAHGTAGPKNRRSYILIGRAYKTKKSADQEAKRYPNLENYKIVPKNKVAKTKFKALYYIKK
jgi:hypothetical protein